MVFFMLSCLLSYNYLTTSHSACGAYEQHLIFLSPPLRVVAAPEKYACSKFAQFTISSCKRIRKWKRGLMVIVILCQRTGISSQVYRTSLCCSALFCVCLVKSSATERQWHKPTSAVRTRQGCRSLERLAPLIVSSLVNGAVNGLSGDYSHV
jgi:hypothetical protein